MNKMSRTDILTYAILNGFNYEDALDLAHLLSPECQSVPAQRVFRKIRQLSDPSGKV